MCGWGEINNDYNVGTHLHTYLQAQNEISMFMISLTNDNGIANGLRLYIFIKIKLLL